MSDRGPAETAPVGAGVPIRVVAVDPARDLAVLENTSALPRLYTTPRHVVAPEDEATDLAYQWACSLHERPPPQAAADAAGGQAQGGADAPPTPAPTDRDRAAPIVVSRLPGHFIDVALPPEAGPPEVLLDEPGRIAVRCEGPAWLVVRDWHLPGWRAALDQTERVEVTKADGALMCVFVPGGSHRVDLRYRPPGFLPGCAAAGVAALLILAWLRFRSRQQRAPREPERG